MNKDSYLTKEELEEMDFKRLGHDVKISRRAVFYNTEKIEIGDYVRIDDFAFLSGGRGISIGNYVHIAAYSALYGKFGIKIGDYVNISSRVSIYSNSDDYSGEFMCGPMVDQSWVHDIGKEIVIEPYSIIGTGSVLLPGAMLCEGVAVGAMSLVKKRLESYILYAGVPARCIKKRAKEMLRFTSLSNGGGYIRTVIIFIY